MFTNIMKSVAIAALLLAALWRPSEGYLLGLQLVIFMSALLVMMQVALDGRFLLASGFLVAAVLFNPVAPVPSSVLASLWLKAACLMLFMFSVILSRSKPTLSISSITGRTPGSESL